MSVPRRMHPALLGALVAGILAVALLDAATAVAGPTVTVRVEGESTTLLPLTSVTLGAVDPLAPACPYNSANAAINLAVEAVGGTWDHGTAKGEHGDFVQTILGESHVFEANETTWDVWINDKWGGGICEDLLAEGDEVLVAADHDPQPTYAPTRLPLVLTGAPRVVEAGTPFTIDVEKVHTRPGTYPEEGEGTPEPESGVTVSGGGVSATSAASGFATLALTTVGDVTLQATKAGDVPSAQIVICVHNGNDGNCGTTAPGVANTTGSTTTLSSSHTGVGGFQSYKTPVALAARLTGLFEGHVYGPRQAPLVLTGGVTSGGPVSSLSIELHRRYEGRCWEYNGVRERFVRARCGQGTFFKVSDDGTFSYLLPAALGPGRYVLDLRATDADGQETKLARGSTRIVFYVR